MVGLRRVLRVEGMRPIDILDSIREKHPVAQYGSLDDAAAFPICRPCMTDGRPDPRFGGDFFCMKHVNQGVP